MRKIVVDKNNKKIVNYIKSQFHHVPESAIYKALRKKDIRVNGIKVSENLPVKVGDELEIYMKDEVLYGPSLQLNKETIVYEDENMVILNKPQGILVQGTENDIGLDQLVNDYFHTNTIVPCHRLDRNTSGLIIFAKDSESEEIILKLIKNHEISKFYSCLVYGHPKQKTATLTAYLFKDRKNKNVIISDEKKKGYVKIVTKYLVLEKYEDNTSLLEVELVTGKTHQIRAHLAHVGFPIIGDEKYGNHQINKQFQKTWQELRSNKICFQNAYGKLEYLRGKSFCLK